MTLFSDNPFLSHSGKNLFWKIECDSLTDDDLKTITALVRRKMPFFREVVGVPKGGLRFAEALKPYVTPDMGTPLLIVDDVYTTGKSMLEERAKSGRPEYDVDGVVLFARRAPLPWIKPVFVLGTTFWD